MTRLNEDARLVLRNVGISMAAWARRNGYSSGLWGGDSCGCPDDRCIGYHHDRQDECQCLRSLLDSMAREAAPAASAPPLDACTRPMASGLTCLPALAEGWHLPTDLCPSCTSRFVAALDAANGAPMRWHPNFVARSQTKESV